MSAHVPFEERFFAYVDRAGPVAAVRPDLGRCWLWTGGTARGYPQVWYAGRPISGRRAAYMLASGEVPPAGWRYVNFACGLQLCVNPAHVRPICNPVGPSALSWNTRHDSCPVGHRLDSRTAIAVPGGVTCRACLRDRDLAAKRHS